MSEDARHVLVSRRLLDDPRFWSGHHAVIAYAVIRHAGVEGRAEVSVRAIARETKIPQTTVRRVLAAMAASDFVKAGETMTIVAARERIRKIDRGCATSEASSRAGGSPSGCAGGSPSESDNVASDKQNQEPRGEPVAHLQGAPVAHLKSEPTDWKKRLDAHRFPVDSSGCTSDSHASAHVPAPARGIPCPDNYIHTSVSSVEISDRGREAPRLTDPIPTPDVHAPLRAVRATGDTGDAEVSPAPVSASLEPPGDDPDPWGSMGQRYGDAWMGPGAELRLAPHDVIEAYRIEWEQRTGRPCGTLAEMHHGKRLALERQILDAIEDGDLRYHGRKAVSLWFNDPYPAQRRWPLPLLVSQIGRIMATGRRMEPGEPDPRLAGQSVAYDDDLPF